MLASRPDRASAVRALWLGRARFRAAGEALIVGSVLAVALLLRVGLASRGWPAANSDEATLGLMTWDILRHGAHPVFFYGQHYMGALQAYLAVPAFAVFGPTSFALHVTTTLQSVAFMLVLYALTRLIYSRAVAVVTLLLLAIGPPAMLFFELRAGAGTQDTLLFGALVLLLTCARLRRPWRGAARVAPALGIGVAAGLGLWADLLILPFLIAAAVPLGLRAVSSRRSMVSGSRMSLLALEAGTGAAGFCLGAAPLLASNIASRGATLAQTLAIAGHSASDRSLGGGLLLSLVGQVAGTLLVALPRMLGSTALCGSCAAWPFARFAGSPMDALRALLSELPFTLCAVGVFAWALREQARQLLRRRMDAHPRRARDLMRLLSEMDARWWGRTMLTIVAGTTILAYMLSPVSFLMPEGTGRYLVAIFLAMPLFAALVWHVVMRLGVRHSKLGAFRQGRGTSARVALAGAICLGILFVDAAGFAQQLAEIRAQGVPGVSTVSREQQLATFLAARGSTRFYTTYWVCDLIMFDSNQRMRCAVIRDGDAFAPGLNRVQGNWALLRASVHPAYVFDTRASRGIPLADLQIANATRQGDARLKGYAYARVAGYDVYYASQPWAPAAG